MTKIKELEAKVMESVTAGDKEKAMEIVKHNLKFILAAMAIGLIGHGFWKVIGINKHDLGI